MTEVVLKFDYIDDEIHWPEFSGGRMVVGWVTAVADIRRVLLNVARIKKVYAYGGKIYVIYDAESVDRYSKYIAPLPPHAVELDFDIHYQRLYGDGCTCKIWRFSISTLYEEERFIKKLLDVEVEMEHSLSNASYPLNFTLIPVDIVLYTKHIDGIAVVENPRFRQCKDEDTYHGKYVVLAEDETGFTLYRIKDDVDISQLKKRLLERLQYED
jgi:hypothetical protein